MWSGGEQLGNERIDRSVLLNHGFVRRCQISRRKFLVQTRVNGLIFVRLRVRAKQLGNSAILPRRRPGGRALGCPGFAQDAPLSP